MIFVISLLATIPLAHAGPWDDLLKMHNPWRGFSDDDSILTVTRIYRADTGKCEPWLKALADTMPGRVVPEGDAGWTAAWEAWAPWPKADLDGVKSCDDFPCAVKLNRDETTAMKQEPVDQRLSRFESLVAARVKRYRATGPEAYESRGSTIDPWTRLEKDGYAGALSRPGASSWYARQFNLDPNRMKTMHQILEVKSAAGPGEAETWLRAAYSDHYFDAWGEWRDVKCGATDGYTVALVLVVDFDLLKNTDIISRIAHGRMRNVIRDNGSAYLDGIFDELSSTEKREAH